MEKYDLHIHSTCSDGEKDVEDIIKYAKENDFNMISITDHDDIESIKKIKACELGNLKVVPGVEISASYREYDLHILCYGFKRVDNLGQIIQYQKEMRINKFYELIKQLNNKYGIAFSDEDIAVVLQKRSIGKNDIASLLVKNNFAKTRKDAFNNFIVNLSSSAIKKVDFFDIVRAMKEDDGIIIMAHPLEAKIEYKLSKEQLHDLIDSIIKDGCQGIEAYHSVYNLQECNELKEYAKTKKYLVSAGSDFHRDEGKSNDGIGFLYKCSEDEDYKNISENDINLLNILKEERRWIANI